MEKIMANGSLISLESMFWEQSDPSELLIKEIKQTLVQIGPESFESCSIQLSVSLTG